MSDLPQDGQASAEITSGMIEAGVAVYLEHCPDTGVGDRIDRKMVAEIFEAMRRFKPLSI